MNTSFHWRDRRWANELTIKTIFMCLMMDETNFLMISERQSRSGYADLAMLVRPDRRHLHLKNVVIEFKFIKTKNLNLKDIKGRSRACCSWVTIFIMMIQMCLPEEPQHLKNILN